METGLGDAVGMRWTGVLRIERRVSHDLWLCAQVLTGTSCTLASSTELGDVRITIYGALVASEGAGFALSCDHDTKIVPIPLCSPIPTCAKEVCSGLASMSLSAAALGIAPVAAMDISPLVTAHLDLNGHQNVILGDVNHDADLYRIHCCGPPSGCLWLAGFPCQAFSRQGDRRGFEDRRASTFYGVLKGAWYNQAAMVMLECVAEVNQYEEIHDGLRALAAALGLRLLTKVLSLEHTWPCRRTRWWAVLIPPQMMLTQLQPMPSFGYDSVDKIIPVWGRWAQSDEAQLELGGLELQLLHDPSMGHDQRVLQTSGCCATFLHSYGSALAPCPCGCRSAGLSPQRLARGGLRGVYVHSCASNLPRWLHPREVALLQTLPPDLRIADDLKATLALLGQVAAPAQALWVLAQCFSSMLGSTVVPEHVLRSYLERLRLMAHHTLPQHGPDVVIRPHVGDTTDADLVFLTSSGTLVRDMRAAINRWDCTQVHWLHDQGYVVPDHAFLQHSGRTGKYELVTTPATASMPSATQLLKVTVQCDYGDLQALLKAGSFVFQAFWHLRLQVQPCRYNDNHGAVWFADSRVWDDLTLIEAPVLSMDCTEPLGSISPALTPLVDCEVLQSSIQQITADKLPPGAYLLPLKESMALAQPAYVPPETVRLLSHGASMILGIFQGCNHWAYFVAVRSASEASLHYFDGLAHLLHPEIKNIACWVKHLWGARQVAIHYDRCIIQTREEVSAVIALGHLALTCGLQCIPTCEQLAQVHQALLPVSQVTVEDEEVMVTSVGLDMVTLQEAMEEVIGIADVPVCAPPVALVHAWMQGDEDALTDYVSGHKLDVSPLACMVCLTHHWFLVVLTCTGDWLDVDYYDGLTHCHEDRVRSLATWAVEQYKLKGYVMNYTTMHGQKEPDQCGVVALANLMGALQVNQTMAPVELDLWRDLLMARSRGRGGPRGCGGDYANVAPLPSRLATLLEQKGVPGDRSSERALAGLQVVGEAAVEAALASKNPWAELKQVASKPTRRFLWVKHDELMLQVRNKAAGQFGVAASNKRSDRKKPRADPGPLTLNPEQLMVMADQFVDEAGDPVAAIPFTGVKNQAQGLALATPAQVIPFLAEGKSLSVGPLAVLTVGEVPHDQHGLLPVDAIRFPAEYVGTKEPILVQGSLVQLGDITVTRLQDNVKPSIESNRTCTHRLTVFRDEWEASDLGWDEVCRGPVRALFHRQPALTLCRGTACGGQCAKYHAPVDVDCDSLITDLWDRRWSKSDGGGRVQPDKAACFSILIRVLQPADDWIQQISGKIGIYVEPRQTDGKGPRTDFGVIWLPQATLQDAEHRQKTVEGVVAITRLGQRYGLRFQDSAMEEAFKILRPKEEYHKVAVDKIFLMYPLPHGTTRQGLQKSLKEWGWDAKPTQPTRGGAEGAGWHVGSANAPPKVVLQSAQGDVVVTPVRSMQVTREPSQVLSSFKTRAHLKTHAASSSSGAVDPWVQHGDPWASFKPTAVTPVVAAPQQPPAVQSKLKEVEHKLRADVRTAVRRELEEQAACEDDARMQSDWDSDVRLCRLETSMTELKAQSARYEQWFEHSSHVQHELGARVDMLAQDLRAQREDMQALDGSTQKQCSETKASVAQIRADVAESMQKGFNQIEAMLAKRPRVASQSPHE